MWEHWVKGKGTVQEILIGEPPSAFQASIGQFGTGDLDTRVWLAVVVRLDGHEVMHEQSCGTEITARDWCEQQIKRIWYRLPNDASDLPPDSDFFESLASGETWTASGVVVPG